MLGDDSARVDTSEKRGDSIMLTMILTDAILWRGVRS